MARAAVVLAHGRGQTADFMREEVVARLPRGDVAYLAPQAADRSWYPELFLAPLSHNQPELSHAVAVVDAAVRAHEAAGFGRDRQLLVGFSQGGCVVAEYVRSHPSRYGGVVICTGGLAGPPGTTWPATGHLEGTPMVLTTAERDPWVPPWRVHESAAVFERLGAVVSCQVFSGGDHAIRREEIDLIAEQLAALSGGPASGGRRAPTVGGRDPG